MLRLQVLKSRIRNQPQRRLKSSSSFIRNTFINYFKENYGHKHIKSSSVVPLCDPTVPFVNAGMNQFKGVFLGVVDAPCPRAVNSQKCIRVGGKHNDLDLVGIDGHHHTFFEMLGNWSFGDYYKKEACQMAWNLLLGPYKMKPENLLVTYFAGDAAIGLQEDRECRDIWKAIGVPSSHIKAHGARDNFWEMGLTGPCGPCTEIHYIHPDGSLTEIWNIVFIQCNREADGSVSGLRRQHVDTGMGLERMTALLQGVPSNYDTDLFQPLIAAIEKNSKGVAKYGASYKSDATVDRAYRRLADHARMISVCLADGAFPSSSLNLKQIMRKSFKISSEVFQNSNLLSLLYNEMMISLGDTYPELVIKEKDAKLIIDHEKEGYAKLNFYIVSLAAVDFSDFVCSIYIEFMKSAVMAPINVDVVNGSKVGSPAKKTLPEVETDNNGHEQKRYSYEMLVETANFLLSKTSVRPTIGVICGSGLGSLAETITEAQCVPYEEIPNFPVSTVEGHHGRLVFGYLGDVPVVAMQGRFHYYEGYPLWKCCLPVRVMKLLGVHTLIATNAAGGLNPNYKIGDIMIVKDHINMMGFAGNNPLHGPNDERFGPRFPPMNKAYNFEYRKIAKEVAKELNIDNIVNEGVYTCLGGPNFETVAELNMLKMVGVDAVGMSTVHEVITARHCDMNVFGMSLITNECVTSYDLDNEANHEEVLDVGRMRQDILRKYVTKLVDRFTQLMEAKNP